MVFSSSPMMSTARLHTNITQNDIIRNVPWKLNTFTAITLTSIVPWNWAKDSLSTLGHTVQKGQIVLGLAWALIGASTTGRGQVLFI